MPTNFLPVAAKASHPTGKILTPIALRKLYLESFLLGEKHWARIFCLFVFWLQNKRIVLRGYRNAFKKSIERIKAVHYLP